MKTRLLIIIGIIVISAAVIFFSYVDVMRILSDEHYEIEITGLKDAYTTDEVYSFDYHVTGYGDGCAQITATYPNEDGKTTTTAREPSCDAGRHFGIIDTSSLHGPLGNIAIKIPGTYKISITYDPIGSLLFATITKEFEVIDADLFSLTYKDFGISSSEPVYHIEVRTDEQLQRVLDKCEYKRKKASGEIPSFTPDGKPILSIQPLVRWNNSTHYNDNNICYFQPLKEHLEHVLLSGILEYCNSDKGAGWDNPFEVWFANETHYIDSDICLWQKLDDSIVLVLPTGWQNVYEDDFDATWSGLGNKHPAFLGYYIPDICTYDIVKFLKKNSNMFDNNVPYSHLDGPTDIGINPDDMVQCENELLEIRDKEPSWPGK